VVMEGAMVTTEGEEEVEFQEHQYGLLLEEPHNVECQPWMLLIS
jgi:hypothetical protein